jgi:hypothetical protein
VTPEEQATREVADRIAAEVSEIVAASYLVETAGRPLSAAQRAQRTRAERLARYLVRQDAKQRGNR